ncbi:MAG TPA: hypothetical protein VGL26_06265 [Jatrophihabitans sp.]
MTVIAAVESVLAENRYTQGEITDAVVRALDEPRREPLLRRLHGNTSVRHRHLALPLAEYANIDDFGAANRLFIEVGTALAETAFCRAIERAGLAPSDVDMVMSTTVTGVVTPSLEALLANRVGLRPDVKRIPLFGLGCVAGAAGVARMHDFLRNDPDAVAVLLSVELCSLTVQTGDDSTANLIASGLFGDGSSAVVMVGDRRAERLPASASHVRVIDSRSHLYPRSERTMGWDVGQDGLKIVLGAEVPELVERYIAADVEALLAAHGLGIADVVTWVCHPGGPKVMDAIESALQLEDGALDVSRRSLADVGNLSSSSVLRILRDTIALQPPSGTPGVMLAMGPGFCSESVLLTW